MYVRVVLAFVAVSLLVLAGGPAAWAQTSVPYVFTANTPAKAAEVNANFDALEAGLNAVEAQVGGVPVDSTTYPTFGPFPAEGAGTENVVILKEVTNPATGAAVYHANVFYTASGGVPTGVFAVVTTSDGTTATDFDKSVQTFDAASLRISSVTNYVNTVPPAEPTTVNGTFDYTVYCFTPARYGRLQHCVQEFENTFASSPRFGEIQYRRRDRIFSLGSSATPSAVSSVTFNGLTFTDAVFRTDYRHAGEHRVSIIANGVGRVFLQESGGNPQAVVWYRIGGVASGSLSGTPFAASGDADGVFFTP